MPPFVKRQDTISLDRSSVSIGAKAAAYLSLKAQEKQIQKQIAELRGPLEEYLKAVKQVDINDSEYVVVRYGAQKFELVRTAVKTSSPIDTAIDIIEQDPAFDRVRDELLEEVVELNTGIIEELILHERMTEEDALKFMQVNTNYSFKVKKIQ